MSEQIKSPLNWDCSYALPLPSGISCGGGGDVTIEQVESTSAQSASAAVAQINHPVRSAMAGNVVLTEASAQNQWLVPDADRSATLPAEGATPWVFTIHHAGAAHSLTVKRASAVVLASLIPDSTVTAVWDGAGISVL